MFNIQKATHAIKKAKKIAISGHMNPDGDSLGSLLSLGLALEKLGKKVYMLCPDNLPKSYWFLPGAKRLSKKTEEKVDLAIAVDCSTYEMLGGSKKTFEKARAIMEIDHHEFRKPFGDIQVIDNSANSVGELVYELLKAMKVRITRDIAENILTSIIVETNLFTLHDTEPFTFVLCAKMVEKGVRFSKLVRQVYGPRTKRSALLSAFCLLRCRFLAGGKIVWSMVKKKDFARFKAQDSDVDPVPNEMCAIEGVRMAILFREKNSNVLRVSLRSKEHINVGALAERYKGGGHSDISGCFIPNNPKSIRRLLSAAHKMVC